MARTSSGLRVEFDMLTSRFGVGAVDLKCSVEEAEFTGLRAAMD